MSVVVFHLLLLDFSLSTDPRVRNISLRMFLECERMCCYCWLVVCLFVNVQVFAVVTVVVVLLFQFQAARMCFYVVALLFFVRRHSTVGEARSYYIVFLE